MAKKNKQFEQDMNDEEFFYEGPSKSELKRQMTALQELGETLVDLPASQLANMPIEDSRLLTAIDEVKRINSNSARTRHLQFIGKLMRNIDPEPIRQALDEIKSQHQNHTAKFHHLEELRDLILKDEAAGIEQVLAEWPQAERQKLRQLFRQNQQELKNNKPPAASRKLFKYLRQLQEESE